MPSFTDTLKVNGEEMQMYASIPSGSGPHPAVVIAFHVGGVDEFDKTMADRLAAEGYVAVVPDMFHRLSEEVMAGPRLDRLGHLSDPDIIADINASVDFLKGQSAVDSDRIGITGFCMGGAGYLAIGGLQPDLQGGGPFLRRRNHGSLGRHHRYSLRPVCRHPMSYAFPLRRHRRKSVTGRPGQA